MDREGDRVKRAEALWSRFGAAIEDPRVDPQRDAHAAGERERLLEAVRQLSVPYRQVVVLVLEGIGHAEIAEVLGIAEGTARVRLLRAKEKLKELLAMSERDELQALAETWAGIADRSVLSVPAALARRRRQRALFAGELLGAAIMLALAAWFWLAGDGPVFRVAAALFVVTAI